MFERDNRRPELLPRLEIGHGHLCAVAQEPRRNSEPTAMEPEAHDGHLLAMNPQHFSR